MNNKQLVLSLGILLSSTVVYAEEIQFINGDTLDVTLIKQTSSTITFSHISLGEMTINKVKISNLHSINLDGLRKEIKAADKGMETIETLNTAEVDEAKALAEIKAAKEKVIIAKKELDVAKEQLIIAQEYVKIVDEVDIDEAEHAVITATKKVEVTEKALVDAVDHVYTVKENIEIAKKVKVANVELLRVKKEAETVNAERRAISREVRVAKKELRIIEETEGHIAQETVTLAEEKIELTEEAVEIVEQQVKTMEEKMRVAEDNVKLAKGEKVHNGFMGTGWFRDWDSSIELGMRGSSGSSVNANFRTAFNTRYEDADHRWDFKTFYLLASEDKISSQNRINALLIKDWFFADTKWFAFASAMYDWDEFKDFNHRLQLSVGPGYQFIKTEEWEFSGRVAGTGVFEFGKTQFDVNGDPQLDLAGNEVEKDVLGFEAMIGADLTWHISAKQHFILSNYIYPSLTSLGEFRNLTIASWTHDIDWFEGLAIKFGIRNEYDTSESIENDFNYNFSLLWGF